MLRLNALIGAAALAAFGQTGPTRGYISQIASGGGWKTTLTLVNPWSTPANVTVVFLNAEGQALQLPMTVTSRGAIETLTGVEVSRSILPLSTLLIETEAPGERVLQGWAWVLAGNTLSGSSVFRQRGADGRIAEAVVPLTYGATATFAMSYDNSEGASTGVALVNLSDRALEIGVTVRDQNGLETGTRRQLLFSLGHTAFDVGTLFGELPQRGSLEFSARSPGAAITGIGFRFTPGGGITSLPILSLATPIPP